MKKLPRGGDCYDISGRFILNEKKDSVMKLVHGVVSGQGALTGLRIGHAWIEKDNEVIEKSNGHNSILPKDLYYSIGQIDEKEIIRYTVKEAKEQMLKFEHFGPWTSIKGLLGNDNPCK